MKRRNFLKTGASLGLYPLAASSLPLGGVSITSPFLVNPCNVTDRSLVLIFLNGANDIVNTTVALDQLSAYANHRPTTYLPQNQLITLDSGLASNQQIGLHPSLSDFKSLYDSGLLTIIQRAGYAAPNKSHFKATDNWMTGSGGSTNQNTGWIGRFLQDRYPGYNGNPFLGEPDPLGILIGSTTNTGFHTFEQHNYEINLSGQDPAGFYSLISSLSGAPIPNIPNTEHGGKLSFLTEIENSVNVYAQRISSTFNNGSNSSSVTYPNSNLGDQLKSIARMLAGGSRTKIFMASKGGWDNHSGLVDGNNSITGTHANLLGDLGASIKAFQDDLAALSLDGNVMTVVFSEFGRKIIENGSLGIDHGTLTSMFVVGKGAKSGVIGDNLDLDNQDNQGAANPNQLQNDYRTVFATLAQDWLGAKDESLQNTFIAPSLYSQKLDIIDTSSIVPASCYYTPQPPIVCACLHVKIYLEGYFDQATGEMRGDLLAANLLPTNQPFNVAPFSYAGTETVTTFPTDTTDWILVQLRDSSDISTIIGTKAALIKKDGLLMETDGTPGISFPGIPDGEYHLALFHRSHLAVLSSDTILTDAPSSIYDFSISDVQAFGDNQLKQVGSTYCMIAGDLDHDNIINNQDFDKWKQNEGSTSVYHDADINGDGNIDAADETLWRGNRSKLGNL